MVMLMTIFGIVISCIILHKDYLKRREETLKDMFKHYSMTIMTIAMSAYASPRLSILGIYSLDKINALKRIVAPEELVTTEIVVRLQDMMSSIHNYYLIGDMMSLDRVVSEYQDIVLGMIEENEEDD